MAEIDSAAFAKLTSALQGQSVALDKLTSQLGSQDREFLQTAKPITIQSVQTRQGMRPFDTAIADAVARAQRPAQVTTVEREKEESLLMKIAKGVVGVGAAVLVIKAVMDNPELKRSFNAVVGQIKDFFVGDEGIITKALGFLFGGEYDPGFFLVSLEQKLLNLFDSPFLTNVMSTGIEIVKTLYSVVKQIIDYIKNPETLVTDIKAGAKSIFSGLVGFAAGGLGALDILTDDVKAGLVKKNINQIMDVVGFNYNAIIEPALNTIGELIADIITGTDRVSTFLESLKEKFPGIKNIIVDGIKEINTELNNNPLIGIIGTASKTLEDIRVKLEKDPDAKLSVIESFALNQLEKFGGNAAAPADLTKPIESLDTQIKTLSEAIAALTNSINGMNNGNGNGNGEPDPTDTGSFYNPLDQNLGIEQRLMARQLA